MKHIKILRTTTVPESLGTFCRGLLRELQELEGYEVIALSSPGDVLDRVGKHEGVRTVAIPMERRMAPFKDLKSLWMLIRAFRREKPDMVHSMTPKAGLLCMMAAWICRVPVRVHTFTGLVFPTATGFTKKLLIFTDRLTCACATHVIPEGDGVKSDLINYGITRKPLQVLGHGNVRGIDLKHYDRTPEVMEVANRLRQKEVFSFIFIGRIVKDKGINELVKAFSKLNNEISATRLILVGPYEQDLDPVLPETLEEIERNQAIEAVGSQTDVRPWLAASDALVFPSYREGFPNVVIEAGAMGLPSIVTDINGSREIIIDGENGTIIQPQDSEDLYSAMKRMIQNPGSTGDMAAKARGLITSRYEQGYVRQCLKDFYKKILGN